MPHRTAPEAEADLDEIWRYVAVESGSLKTADKLIDAITRRFLHLARYPKMGRNRDADLRIGLRSFTVGNYVIIYRYEARNVLILRVIHASRDLPSALEI